METTTPLNSDLIEGGETQESHREDVVTDDRAIFDELIAPLETRMMRSIWRIVRNTDLAEDCLQDALTVIWKKRFLIRRHPNPPALILKICLDTAYNTLRSRKYLRSGLDLSGLNNIAVSQNQQADQELKKRELVEHLQRAISRLPRKRALAVMMRLVQEESFEAIAQALNCSEVTARIHTSKGCSQIRKWLSPLYRNDRQEVDA
jgi:RNA polymerase sigma-70 factor (ECF subfamily)